jgi:uncharacterized protein YgiM (DUF1202 family)
VGTAQAALQAQGYSVGGVDDIYGNNTQYAVEQFQSNQGLSRDGIIGPATASALGLDPNISCGNNSGGGGGDNGSAYVNTNGDPLNVRSGPGTDYDVISSLPDGTSVSIVNQQGNWGELPNGGWVSLSWITSGNGSSNSGGGGGGDNGSAYVNTNGDPLNVRSGPGTDYGVISSLPDGTSVSIVNQQGNWGELPNGGWVSLSWISGL